MAGKGLMNTKVVCEATGLSRPYLQLLIGAVGLHPIQKTVAGRRHNFYTPIQVEQIKTYHRNIQKAAKQRNLK